MVLHIPIILFLLIVPNLSEPLELPRSLALILLTLIIAVTTPIGLRPRSKILYLPFLVPIFYFISAVVNEQNLLNALFGGYKRNFGILTYIAVAVIFLIVSNSRNYNSTQLFKYTLLPISILIIIYSIIQILKIDYFIWGETDRVVLTLGNSNYAASYIAILLPTCLYGIVNFRNNIFRFFLGLCFFALIYCGLQTKSFQFLVVAFVTIISFLVINYFNFINKIKNTQKLVIILSSILVFLILLNNFRNLLNELTSADDRLAQQRAGLDMFMDHPLFGVGVDNLQKFMPMYIRPEDIRREGIDIVADKTHNVLVDHLANGGLFTGTAYILFLGLIFYFIGSILKHSPKGNLNLALPASIFIGYVFQLFINTDSIVNLPIPYICMGLISSYYLQQKNSSAQSIKGSVAIKTQRISALILLLIVIPLSSRLLSTDYQVRKVLNNEYNTGEQIVTILNLWPYPRPTELVIVKYINNLENCKLVNDLSSRLLEVNSRSGQAWFAKSICADAINDQVSALKFVNKAIEFHPLNVRYLIAKYQLEKFLDIESDSSATLFKLKSLGVEPE
jgi:O-antigen ligase